MVKDKESIPQDPVQANVSPSESEGGTTSTRRRGAESEAPTALEEPQKRRGRPKKQEIASHKPGGRKKVGRPKGDTGIMAEYKARMLASPKSRKVITKVFDTALEDGHPHQAACMKMVMDRIAPLSSFAEKKENEAPKFEINFIGMEPKEINATKGGADSDSDIVDAEYEPVQDSDE